MKLEILYVFGGEKAQGAEIVIERLMSYNTAHANAHLMVSPGEFADKLIAAKKPYKITHLNNLKKLNRSANDGVNFYLKALVNYFVISWQVFRYIRKHNIKIIHANTIVPASYLLPLILFSKIFMPSRRWLWSDHDMKYFARLDHILANLCVKLYNNTLVVSQAVKQKYAPNDKITTLYNGLDTQIFKADNEQRQDFRAMLNISHDKIVFGMAANICPGKGQLQLINAFNAVSQTNPNVLLILAGNYAFDDVKYNEDVRTAIDSNDRIIYLGFINSMISFYNGCDVILNNSDLVRSESLGTTIYEAMACEKIVLAAKTGGTPEIITHKADGFIFEAENLTELKGMLGYVIEYYDQLSYINKAARIKVAAKFNILTMVLNYNAIITYKPFDNIRQPGSALMESKPKNDSLKPSVLYVFGGEKAQGAEIVIERLINHNDGEVNAHLFLAPGKFASELLTASKPYTITIIEDLKKLNRSSTSSFSFYLAAVRKYFSIPYKVYKYVKSHKISVIHSNTIVPASYLIPLIIYSRLFMRSKLWLWSDHDLVYFSKIDHWLSEICVKLYDYTLVVSEAVKLKFNSNDSVFVLYNGLDINFFKPDAIARLNFRKSYGLKEDGAIILGMAAIISPIKGQLELIRTFNKLCETRHNIKLIFAGRYGEDHPDYNDAVKKEIEQNSRINYLGYVNNMVDFYNGCDVVVSNSTGEPLGTNIYEAMSCEKILVASDSGGTPEIINDRNDGFLFKAGNTEDLMQTLSYIFEHYDQLDAVRKAARNKVKERFNISTMMRNYNNLLIKNSLNMAGVKVN